MEHPLVGDLNDLTPEQLQEKISELNKRINMAMRTGHVQMLGQLRMVLETYQTKYNEKVRQQWNQKNGGAESFEGKIDIS